MGPSSSPSGLLISLLETPTGLVLHIKALRHLQEFGTFVGSIECKFNSYKG